MTTMRSVLVPVAILLLAGALSACNEKKTELGQARPK
jgi:predicted small secreted protein